MGSFDNRFRRKWQDYGGANATVAEHSFIDVFSKLFEGTEYEVISQPTFCELLTPKGISFGDCCLFSFPASSCHGFLGHGVGHPPLGSPQA